MAKKLQGKVAIVTGAGSEVGIGKETALAMAAEGAKVVVNDIGKDADGKWGADRVVKMIKDAKGTAVANYDSVVTMAGGQAIVKTALDNFGRLDILVNTAGNTLRGPTVDFKESDWDSVINLHLKGAFSCTQASLKPMLKQKSGRIINITSIAAWLPLIAGGVPSAVYSTAKSGVLGFSKMLANEMKEHGITVNAISPKARTKLFPMPGKVVEGVQIVGPDYVAPMICYLATDEAKDITGQLIYIGSGDIIVFAPPMGAPGEHQHMHKIGGKWTFDELADIMPFMWWGHKPAML
jgi:NAD(P)-dependent dehydrogenase (short-subunit alcohol dehydrogenase family)